MLEQVGDDAEAGIKSGHESAGYMLAEAALDRFERGEDDWAAKLAKRSLAHLGHSADPCVIYEKLIRRLRQHHRETYRKNLRDPEVED